MRRHASPLRLTWDWDWPPVVHRGATPRRPPPEVVRRIGAEIVRARVLLLEVGYPDLAALRSGELADCLAGFEGALSLVLAPAAAAALGEARPWTGLSPERVWLDATPEPGSAAAALAGWPAVRYYLTAGNAAAVAAGIAAAVAAGATGVSLPNLPLFGDVLRAAETASPSAAQLAALAPEIAAAVRGRGVELRVHHYALWQALRAAGAEPEGEDGEGAGCQAGSALGYVDPTGVLFPCSSLPVPLARVAPGAIGETWSGAELATLCERLGRLPSGCAGCPREGGCHGGCRGWAHYLSGSWDVPGPDCAGR